MEATLIKIARQDTTFYAETRADLAPVVTLCEIMNDVYGFRVEKLEIKLVSTPNVSYYVDLKNFLLCLVKVCSIPSNVVVPSLMKIVEGCVAGLPVKDSNDQTLESWVKEILE